MTPAEHAAVAEAIAALEPLEKAIAEARTNGHLAIRFVGDEYYGVVEKAFASLRALASAPSEAPKPPGQEPGGDPGVGRGELETEVEELRALVGKLNGGAEMQELMRLNNGLADKVRNLTTLLDQQLGTPCEEIRHAQEVEKLQVLALPTADRDAIRESMWQALDDMGKDGHSVCGQAKAELRIAFEAIKEPDDVLDYTFEEATAALALLGEG